MRSIIRISLTLVLFLFAAAAADAAMLRPAATIEGDVIRLGDLFSGLSEKKRNLIVAAAPRPGQKSTFSAGRLQRIATRAGIRWRAVDRYQRSVVRRAGRVMAEDELKDLIADSLERSGELGKYGVEIAPQSNAIYIARDQEGTQRIEKLDRHSGSGRFSAVMSISNDAGKIERHRFSGEIFEVVRIPVLNRHIQGGARISAGDIDHIEIPRNRFHENMAAIPEDIVGKSPRRTACAYW